jgi:hypothetical protein
MPSTRTKQKSNLLIKVFEIAMKRRSFVSCWKATIPTAAPILMHDNSKCSSSLYHDD